MRRPEGSKLVDGGMGRIARVVSSVEVAGATDVAMNYRRPVRGPVAAFGGFQIVLSRWTSPTCRSARRCRGRDRKRLRAVQAEVEAVRRIPIEARKPAPDAFAPRRMISINADVPSGPISFARRWMRFRRPVGIAAGGGRQYVSRRRVAAVDDERTRTARRCLMKSSMSGGDPAPQASLTAVSACGTRVVVLLDST